MILSPQLSYALTHLRGIAVRVKVLYSLAFSIDVRLRVVFFSIYKFEQLVNGKKYRGIFRTAQPARGCAKLVLSYAQEQPREDLKVTNLLY